MTLENLPLGLFLEYTGLWCAFLGAIGTFIGLIIGLCMRLPPRARSVARSGRRRPAGLGDCISVCGAVSAFLGMIVGTGIYFVTRPKQ